LEVEIELLGDKISLVKNALKKYYLELLQTGERTKNNGIIWIILKLWKIKVIIKPSMFPNFLDQDA
jgi:hypothetical protein